jgi:hypothetical protein
MFSRSAIKNADTRLQAYADGAGEPVKGGYAKAKEIIIRWSGTVLAPNQEPAPAARR